MNKSSLTYEKSGVNIKAADKFVKFISSFSKKTKKITNLIISVSLVQLAIFLNILKILI